MSQLHEVAKTNGASHARLETGHKHQRNHKVHNIDISFGQKQERQLHTETSHHGPQKHPLPPMTVCKSGQAQAAKHVP